MCFDDFRLDTEVLRIFRGEAALDAPAQVVEVLAWLVQNRERVVTRGELLERFWPRAGSGGDAALNTCIRRIRSVLGDDAESPRYIQTRPRAGYRFIGTLLAGDGVDEGLSVQVPMTAMPLFRRRAWAITAGLFTMLLVAVVWAHGQWFPAQQRLSIEPAQGLCEYELFPNFNAGLHESLVAQLNGSLPAGYSMATDSKGADLQARISVRQTPQQTVVVLTLIDSHRKRLLWSDEFSAATNMDDYVPLQRQLAERMAGGLRQALDKAS